MQQADCTLCPQQILTTSPPSHVHVTPSRAPNLLASSWPASGSRTCWLPLQTYCLFIFIFQLSSRRELFPSFLPLGALSAAYGLLSGFCPSLIWRQPALGFINTTRFMEARLFVESGVTEPECWRETPGVFTGCRSNQPHQSKGSEFNICSLNLTFKFSQNPRAWIRIFLLS